MFCHHCGKQIPDDTRFCHYCGTPQEAARPAPGQQSSAPAASPAQSAAASASPAPPYTAAAKPKKMPVWGRLLLLFLVVLLGLGAGRLIAASHNASNSSHTQESPNSGMLGDFYVEIPSAEKYVNAYGETLLIVNFGVTNYGDTSHAFGVYVFCHVTQDGEELKQGGLGAMEDDEMRRQMYGERGRPDYMIEPGASVELKLPFILKNAASEVPVEVQYFDGYTGETTAIKTIFLV